MSVIVALSGGKASAWCADWALKNFNKEEVILYFNDTKWEHPDLYRFLNDLSKYFNHPITFDMDGRTPEELFYKERALASDRWPFCSKILKAKRLQRFYKDKDILIFGIGVEEQERGKRLIAAYQKVAVKKNKWPKIILPLVENNITKQQINNFLKDAGIQEPILYSMGFKHNNCSGGCVRCGKKQWKLLYEKLPNIYADRERIEKEVSIFLNKDVTFLNGESLEHFRGRIERHELSAYYDDDDDDKETECIGICDLLS